MLELIGMWFKQSKNKKLLAITALILVITGLLYLNKPATPQEKAEIARNNSNENSQNSNELVDLLTLVPTNVKVPEEFKSGVFAEGKTLNLPKNFEISVFDAGYTKARGMDFDADNNLYVTDSNMYTVKPNGGEIFVVVDKNKDGIADSKNLIDSGLDTPHGIDYYKGNLYVGEQGKVVVYRNIKNDGTYTSKEVLVDTLPTDGGHVTRTVVIGPDEKIYVSVGSSCNICEESNNKRSTVMKYNLDGTGEEIFAEGLRNTVGLAFDDKGVLWGVNNGRDRLGDELPPEEVNIIEQGKHYGWPYCYGDGIPDPEFSGKEEFCKTTTTPVYKIQAHSAPLGIAFYPRQTNFPIELQNNMFITFHGSWNRSIPTGYKVVRINGSEKKEQNVNFITGWLDANGDVWGRPVDIKFDSNGDMYISDDKAGAIYKVTYKELE